MRIDGSFVAFKGDAVRSRQKLGARKNTPGLAHEGGEDFKLGGGEQDGFIGQGGFKACAIEADFANADDFAGRVAAGAS